MAGKSAQSTLVTTSLMLPLGQLRSGHEAGPRVNIRTPVDGPELVALAANIADRIAGKRPPLIEPLLVVAGPKPRGKNAQLFFVSDGSRRLTALCRLRDQGIVTDELQLPVVEHARVDGLEVSTTAAVMAAPHHPVDLYEAFARLAAARGDEPEETTVAFLARRFARTPREVRQIRALGALAPAIRAAWKAGEIDKGTAEAFTGEPDQNRQALVFAQLANSRSLYAYQVRRALHAERINVDDEETVGFVGLDAYQKAGGTLTGDLFTETRYIADRALFDKLAAEKRATIAEAYRAEGWGFVFWDDQPEADNCWLWRNEEREPVWSAAAAEERDRIDNELKAIDASRAAREAHGDVEGEPSGESLAEQQMAFVRRENELMAAALCAAWSREERESLAVILSFEDGVVLAHPGFVPPGLTQPASAGGQVNEEARDDAGNDREDDDDAGDEQPQAPAPAAEPEGPELPRAARQSLSLVANRAAAATIAADPDLAISLLAAAWIARDGDVHAEGNGVPLIVSSDGLDDGPVGNLLAELVAGAGGQPHRWDKDRRTAHFAGLAGAILDMSRPRRLELLAALAAGALDMSSDTLENRNNHQGQKSVRADGIAALRAFLPNAPFETNARLILAGAGEAEALFGDWGKAQLVEAIRAMDGDDAAKQAAKAKKGDLVALVAERAKATGWLPPELRGSAPTPAEDDTGADEREAA